MHAPNARPAAHPLRLGVAEYEVNARSISNLSSFFRDLTQLLRDRTDCSFRPAPGDEYEGLVEELRPTGEALDRVMRGGCWVLRMAKYSDSVPQWLEADPAPDWCELEVRDDGDVWILRLPATRERAVG